MKIAIGSDHAGLMLKMELSKALAGQGHELFDFGAFDDASVDYPDFAVQVGRAVRDGKHQLGVLVCGTGVGMSIVANKIHGVRAALCTTEFEARMTRAHNDANVLCLGERVVGLGLGKAIALAFVETAFEGGRHVRRIEKIDLAEREG